MKLTDEQLLELVGPFIYLHHKEIVRAIEAEVLRLNGITGDGRVCGACGKSGCVAGECNDIPLAPQQEQAALGAVQDGWQPIETAPKDVPILVTNGKLAVVIKRGTVDNIPWADPVGFGGYDWEWDFNWEDLTHWMHISPAPKELNRASSLIHAVNHVAEPKDGE